MEIEDMKGRSIREKEGESSVILVVDQTLLPHRFEVVELKTGSDFVAAIGDMVVRGAGLIGATAAYGMQAAALEAPDADFDGYVRRAGEVLVATRPTARNLEWAVRRQLEAMRAAPTPEAKRRAALATAREILEFDADCSRRIGLHGVGLIERIAATKRDAAMRDAVTGGAATVEPAGGAAREGAAREGVVREGVVREGVVRAGPAVNILTHCNAGALAFVERGTATAPIYEAFERGIALHVWVDETRPRNQGASLTAWELGSRGIPHSLVVDNAGGHLMQKGLVDLAIVGADRVTRRGDAANKIGTYLKALAARDNNVPFYVALPSSTIDWDLEDGLRDIVVEERDPAEVTHVEGLLEDAGRTARVRICPRGTGARNFGFDVTPARLVTALITERGICDASEEGLLGLFPERRAHRGRQGDGEDGNNRR